MGVRKRKMRPCLNKIECRLECVCVCILVFSKQTTQRSLFLKFEEGNYSQNIRYDEHKVRSA
jgi:hypothetical protein